jgi:integrase
VGKGVSRSFYGRDEDEALAKYAAWLADHPNGPPTPQQAAPFNDLVAAWVEATIKPPMRRQGTYEDYLSKIRNHIAPTLGTLPTGEIRHHDVLMWLRSLSAAGHGRTAEKCLEIVRKAFAYGVKNQIIATNPAADVEAPAYERRKARPLTPAEARALLSAAAGQLDKRPPYTTSDGKTKRRPRIDTRLEALYALLVNVGLRRGEALALRWSDLDDGTLHVQRQVDDEGREWGYVKTSKSNRLIPLDDQALEALSTHQARMQAEAHDEARKPDGRMFPTSTGGVLRPASLTRHYKQVLAAAGLPPTVRLHDLRHTTGKTAEAAGATIAAISALLGHSNTAITQKLYGHGDEGGVKDAVGRVGKRMRGEP